MTVYTYQDVFDASVQYFNNDELAAKVFVDKYALQNSSGEYLELTPTDMHKRLAKEFARIEKKYPNPISEEEIFDLLDHYKFIVPQGSPMFGVGNDYFTQSLGNCFVVESPFDSYGGILKTDQELVQLMKRRAGVGVDISNIRPKGMSTKNAAKTTDGIGVFMERFSSSCREVAQNGRRGALMLSCSIEHPEIETFISIKKDLKKVTGANISIRITDEFMKAVKSNSKFTLKWGGTKENPEITKIIDAKDLWNKIIDSAWTSAEPGILFWDTIIKNSPADIYAEKYPNFKTQSTNPCFSGDTLIAVADGRNYVSIKQLAEEGKDVPVYSVNKTGEVSIKLGRNPRVTGYNQKLIRIILDDNSHIDLTPNHKCLLLNGTEIQAKDLKSGDSLHRFSKELRSVKKDSKPYYSINCDTLGSKHVFEHRLIAKYNFYDTWDSLYNSEKQSGFIKGGLVVHHKDYNQLNNSPDNLQVMTFKDHSKLHGELDQSGEKNGNYSGITSEKIKEHALNFTKSLGRRFSRKEWEIYASKNKLPLEFSQFRSNTLGNVLNMAKVCAEQLGYEYIDSDPRTVKVYQDMISQNYKSCIVDNEVFVEKECEICKKKFNISYSKREVSFCSNVCSANYLNCNTDIKSIRTALSHKAISEKMKTVRFNQAKIYSELKFNLNRDPLMTEWEKECAKNNISYRVGKSLKFNFKNFKEVKEAGNNFNHKVSSVIELDGDHTVYNITVDDNHTVAIITNILKSEAKSYNEYFNGVILPQCGELPLGLDSCRLLCINLQSFVENPFTNKAKFNFNLFSDVSQKAQRLMDDLIDLEIEKINKIINKIKLDPEPDSVKSIELNLWNQFLKSCEQGRRTGTGITALGDTLAMLNIKYGSKDSINMTEEIYKQLMINCYKSSCIMAGERGSFPIFNAKLEKQHPFILFAMKQDKELSKLYKLNGRRNIALLTTAPTGSVSTQTQSTSGIEPAYLLSYIRRKKHNPSDKNVKVDYVDPMGDSWQEFTVYHHGVKQWMNVSNESDISKSPYFGATSNEIDWLASVEIQSVAQKYIDHSISKTCNLPESATKELVSDVYMKAWELGCKGFTVYRDKCRAGVLISESESKSNKLDKDNRPIQIDVKMAPKRLLELPCDIKKAKVNGDNWTIFIGLLNGIPYEIFGGLSKYVDIPNKHKIGKIIKNGKVNSLTTYNLVLGEGDDEMLVKDIANVFENGNYGAFSRTISLALRHGTPVQYVVEQLLKDKNSEITSFSKVIARVLKNYIKEGTKTNSEKNCPECNLENSFIYQEGCLKCTGCSYSKCG